MISYLLDRTTSVHTTYRACTAADVALPKSEQQADAAKTAGTAVPFE